MEGETKGRDLDGPAGAQTANIRIWGRRLSKGPFSNPSGAPPPAIALSTVLSGSWIDT